MFNINVKTLELKDSNGFVAQLDRVLDYESSG